MPSTPTKKPLKDIFFTKKDFASLFMSKEDFVEAFERVTAILKSVKDRHDTELDAIRDTLQVIKLDQVPNKVRAAEEGSDFAGKAAIWARKNGYDILDMSAGNEAELRILNKKVLFDKKL
jgi:hypothetical protein